MDTNSLSPMALKSVAQSIARPARAAAPSPAEAPKATEPSGVARSSNPIFTVGVDSGGEMVCIGDPRMPGTGGSDPSQQVASLKQALSVLPRTAAPPPASSPPQGGREVGSGEEAGGTEALSPVPKRLQILAFFVSRMAEPSSESQVWESPSRVPDDEAVLQGRTLTSERIDEGEETQVVFRYQDTGEVFTVFSNEDLEAISDRIFRREEGVGRVVNEKA